MKYLLAESDRSRSPTSDSGYTLVEAVLLVTLLGILAAPTSYVILESMKVYARTAPALDASYQASFAVERMQRDLREISGADSITTFGPSALSFTDTAGQTVAFDCTGGDLTRNGALLARGVTSFAFRYLRDSGAVAAGPDELHLIEIDLTVQAKDQESHVLALAFPMFVALDPPVEVAVGSPLDEPASTATAFNSDHETLDLNFVSAVTYGVQIEAFQLSASRAVPKLKKFELATATDDYHQIWGGKEAVPTGTLRADESDPGERVVPGGGAAGAFLEFDKHLDGGPITFTLVLLFTDGSSSTLNISLDWVGH